MEHLNESDFPPLSAPSQIDSTQMNSENHGQDQRDDGDATQVVEQSEPNLQQQEIFVNYDNEIDALRK